MQCTVRGKIFTMKRRKSFASPQKKFVPAFLEQLFPWTCFHECATPNAPLYVGHNTVHWAQVNTP
jgi:hypothetical protein